MNLNNFTIKAQELLQQAQQVAFNNQSPSIENPHLLKALLDDKDSPIQYLLKKNNVNVENPLVAMCLNALHAAVLFWTKSTSTHISSLSIHEHSA